MSEESSAAVAPLTPEEFWRLIAGDTFTVVGHGNPRTVIARHPENRDVLWCYRSDDKSSYDFWVGYANTATPTGATLARLRPEPVEVNQWWRAKNPGDRPLCVLYVLRQDGVDHWEIEFEDGTRVSRSSDWIRTSFTLITPPVPKAGQVWEEVAGGAVRITAADESGVDLCEAESGATIGRISVRELVSKFEFVSDAPEPLELRAGQTWRDPEDAREFSLGDIGSCCPGRWPILSPNGFSRGCRSESFIRHTYEFVSEPCAPALAEAMGAHAREAGDAKLAAALAETDPDLIWRTGWWYRDRLDCHWWRIVGRDLLEVRFSRSVQVGPDEANLIFRATSLLPVLPHFLDPSSGCEKKPEGA